VLRRRIWVVDVQLQASALHKVVRTALSRITKLIPCRRVPLEKLIVVQLVNKFSAFYGTRNFTTAFTRARHWPTKQQQQQQQQQLANYSLRRRIFVSPITTQNVGTFRLPCSEHSRHKIKKQVLWKSITSLWSYYGKKTENHNTILPHKIRKEAIV
jgi:hypothetical protein